LPPVAAVFRADGIFVSFTSGALAAIFGFELAGAIIEVIGISVGDRLQRNGGPGITRSDLLVINKTDLVSLVGVSLEVMDRDARKMRGERPFVFAQVKGGAGVAEIAAFIEKTGGLAFAKKTSAA